MIINPNPKLSLDEIHFKQFISVV